MSSINKDIALENRVPLWGMVKNAKSSRRRKIEVSTLSNLFSKVKSGETMTISPPICVCYSKHKPWICTIMVLDVFSSHPPFLKKKKKVRVFIGVFMLHKC